MIRNVAAVRIIDAGGSDSSYSTVHSAQMVATAVDAPGTSS